MLKKILLLLAASGFGAWPGVAQTLNPTFELRPGKLVVCPSRPETMHTHVAARPVPTGQRGAAGADIAVTYTGFSPEAQAAFQYAVDIWKTQVSSAVQIRVSANWSALATGVLGSAGATTYTRNFPGALQANTWYPVALAEKLAGQDLNGTGNPDIVANFSSAATWYYGTDGLPPTGTYDLVSVVLHELCHGLGFVADTDYDATSKEGSYGLGNPALPLTFTTFIENAAGQRLTDPTLFANPSVALGTQYTSALYFNGPLAVAANAAAVEKRPRLYAPATYRTGSSISHLDETTYPAGTANSLMTYAIGAAEAIHDPGPLVQGMFADMGWVATTIRHAPLRDTETAQDYPVLATVQSDGTVTPGSVKLMYSINNGAFATRTMTATGVPGQYQSSIPNPGLGATVRYYLSAADNETGRTYTAPGQPTPSTPSRAYYQFFVGPDTTPPVVQHTPPAYLFRNQLPFRLVVLAADNLAVASVSVSYSVNGVARPPLALSVQADGVTYLGQLSTTGGPLVAGDVITYRVVATDAAARPNTTTLGPFTVPIVDLKATQSQYVNNFNATSTDFVGAGFTITQPADFADPAIHSTHPYADQTTSVYQLLVPIVVKSDPALATVQFDEIALVEPGEAGSLFGTPEFYDYVVVEGSLDGNTWTPLADGYDARANAQWLSTWNSAVDADGNSTAVGTPSLYAPRTLNLRDKFAAGATVQLRFRLFADDGAHGWGWAIDNLAIQNTTPLATRAETLTVGGLRAYPNPSAEGLLRVQARLAQPTAGAQLEVRNALGQLLRQQQLPGTLTQLDQPLDLRGLPGGLYFVALRAGTETTTCKVALQ
ncbi:MAG: T9SS type A sorting domain-containing protein [Janthinobacterium lividum]